MLKKIFLKKISSVLGLFIVCGFSLTLGAILLRVAYSAFTQPTKPPTDANQELGKLDIKLGTPTDAAGTATVFGRLGKSGDAAGADTVFGKIAGVSGGGSVALVKRVFVTSTTYTGDLKTAGGGTNGLEGADNICQARADIAGLGGVWKAIVCDNNIQNEIRERISYNWDFLYSTAGQPIRAKADMWNCENLTGGGASCLITPINDDEFGNYRNTSVWTGCGFDGTKIVSDPQYDCENWTSGDGGKTGYPGLSTSISNFWIAYISSECNLLKSLYCIEQ